MMSEASALQDDQNGESTFEIVDGHNNNSTTRPLAPAASGSLQPPSALPDFATMTSPSSVSSGVMNQSLPSSDSRPSVSHRCSGLNKSSLSPNIMDAPQAPPPQYHPPPPSIPPPQKDSAGQTFGTNPYSIRAAASSAQSVTRPAAPPVVVGTPFPVQPSQNYSVPQGSAPASDSSSQFAVGLEMGDIGAGQDAGTAGPLTAPDQAVYSSSGGKSGVWGWIRGTVSGSELLTKVAETAKTSVDSVITTLDPQMKDYIVSTGAIEMAIASDKEMKINSVKEGFQRVFSQVVARGLGSPGSVSMAAQPSGFANARKGTEERIASLRHSGLVPKDIPIVAVEGFVFEATPNRFFSADYILLDDCSRNFQAETLTQAIHLPNTAADLLKSHTPPDYAQKESGFAVTVGQAVAEAVGSSPYDWQEQLCGISRRKLIEQATIAIAWQYKNSLSQTHVLLMK